MISFILSYLIPFLILIMIVVFIHEYGHYYFAKKYGVGVTDFSIGFGKSKTHYCMNFIFISNPIYFSSITCSKSVV